MRDPIVDRRYAVIRPEMRPDPGRRVRLRVIDVLGNALLAVSFLGLLTPWFFILPLLILCFV